MSAVYLLQDLIVRVEALIAALAIFGLVAGVMGAFCVAIVARSKGRDPIPWFLYGLVAWPVALTHILVSKPTEQDES